MDDCSDDLNRVCADLANAAGDTAILLSNIADDQDFVETKADYAKEMVIRFPETERNNRRSCSKPYGSLRCRR